VFFDWYGGSPSADRAATGPNAALYADEAFEALRRELGTHPPRAADRLAHPYFARPRPRTMLIEEMEALWTPIAAADDWAPFNQALAEIGEMRAGYGG